MWPNLRDQLKTAGLGVEIKTQAFSNKKQIITTNPKAPAVRQGLS
jgi:hypothetical protein